MQIETACGVPVVSSMPAALWAAARLIGESGYVGPGYGRLLSGIDGQIGSSNQILRMRHSWTQQIFRSVGGQ